MLEKQVPVICPFAKLRNIIFEGQAGSQIWRMDRKEDTPTRLKSDLDLVLFYVAPTDQYLMGTAYTRTEEHHIGSTGERVPHFRQFSDFEITFVWHEVGAVVQQLLDGNLNFLVYVMTPLINYRTKAFDLLRRITAETVAKNCFASIQGMAIYNYRKYIHSNADDTPSRRAKMFRVINFGEHLLRTGQFRFDPVHEVTREMVDAEFQLVPEVDRKAKETVMRHRVPRLARALAESPLPDKPPTKPFREWLLDLRLRYLDNPNDLPL